MLVNYVVARIVDSYSVYVGQLQWLHVSLDSYSVYVGQLQWLHVSLDSYSVYVGQLQWLHVSLDSYSVYVGQLHGCMYRLTHTLSILVNYMVARIA